MADQRRWWEKFPEVYEAEKAALTSAGVDWIADAESEAAGRIKIDFPYRLNGVVREFSAIYPDSYPYFAPQVLLHGDQLPRHHNSDGILCLLSSESEEWQPLVDNLAKLLVEQIPLIEATTSEHVSVEEAAVAEDHVGEPLTNYLNYDDASSVIVPDRTPEVDRHWGRLEFLVRRLGSPPHQAVTAILSKIQDSNRNTIISDEVRPAGFKEQAHGFWARLPERPPIGSLDLDSALQWVQQTVTNKCPPFQNALDASRSGDIFICGLVFADERTWRGFADDWLFLIVLVNRARKGTKPPLLSLAFIRTDWGGEKACLLRAPFLGALREKRVALVGAGAIGAPVVLQLAKSGVREIHLIDSDRVQVGNAVRWALGWGGAGLPKAHILAEHVSREYPRTKVVPHRFRIGVPNVIDGRVFSDDHFFAKLLDDVDLLIDASASYRVNYYLSDLARHLQKPYLWLTTTPGCFGGVVGRIRPAKTPGCWHCFQRSLATHKFPMPSDSGIEMVQPGGCMQATFIGAGVDGEVVSQLASRLAIATLCDGSEGGYSDFGWDVAIGDLNGTQGPLPGQWSTHVLDVHADCTAHQS